MAEKYANAKDVLPEALLNDIQQHFTGHLWVPHPSDMLKARDALIRKLRNEGMTVSKIAHCVHLSKRRILQILCR